jgi:hypothetical protein
LVPLMLCNSMNSSSELSIRLAPSKIVPGVIHEFGDHQRPTLGKAFEAPSELAACATNCSAPWLLM